jgi:hypothetical protein
MSTATTPRAWLRTAGGLWLCALVLGLCALMRYDATPGAVGAAPARWPLETGLVRALDGPTLVVALHPHCPCSRATMDTLEAMLAATRDAPRVYLLFFADPTQPPSWGDSPLWQRAGRMAATRLRDPGGRLAMRFGALTSGAVAAYDRDGTRGFTGGLTPGRGVSLGTDGAASLAARVLAPATAVPVTTPVFGCVLQDRAAS